MNRTETLLYRACGVGYLTADYFLVKNTFDTMKDAGARWWNLFPSNSRGPVDYSNENIAHIFEGGFYAALAGVLLVGGLAYALAPRRAVQVYKKLFT